MKRKYIFTGSIVILFLVIAGISYLLYNWQDSKQRALRQEYQAVVQIAKNATEIEYKTFREKVLLGQRYEIEGPVQNKNIALVFLATDPSDSSLGNVLAKDYEGNTFVVKLQKTSNQWVEIGGWLYFNRVKSVAISEEEYQRLVGEAVPPQRDFVTFWDSVLAGYTPEMAKPKQNQNIQWVMRKSNAIDSSIEEIFGEFSDGKYFIVYMTRGTDEWAKLTDLLISSGIPTKTTPIVPKTHWMQQLIWIAPTFFLIIVIGLGSWWMVTRGPLSAAMRGFGKKEKREGIERPKERFSDVAGMEEIITEVDFIVKFFKKPHILKRLGGKPKKGVLLSGSPGVGKTLLARAIAGEANVNFFSISGSEFVEIFVGVGASKIRDLFKTAKKFAPAIVFIDEVDSLGKRQSGVGDSAGQEYRQTLNQLLAEMDGFDPLSGILVIFASNFPELIDPALRRKGRIDSEIKIPLPSLEGRKEIFKVHLRKQVALDVLEQDVSIDELANKTYNFSGADIANFINEAVFGAVKKEKEKISKADFDEAFDIIALGLAGKPVGDFEERRKIAIHEAGHVLVSRLLPELKKLRMQVASILRRSDSHGVVQLIQEGDIRSLTPGEFEARICFYFGGRAAEKVAFGVYSSGASMDLRNATLTARAMIRDNGMSKLGPIVIPDKTGDWRDEISEEMLRDFEMEEMALLKACEKRTEELMSANEQMLRDFADVLVLKEELREQEIDDWMGEFNKLHPKAA